MSPTTAEEFFSAYEQANHNLDVQVFAKLYADIFMFGTPQGVQAIKKDDFLKVLPRRKEFMKTAGLLSSLLDSVQVSKLDSKYVLVKTVWNMTFRANSGSAVTRKTSATYILSSIGDTFEIVFQLDHQDLMKIMQELNTAAPHRSMSDNA